jgi:hypothetical protein
MTPVAIFTTLHFRHYKTNKLECHSRLGCKGLQNVHKLQRKWSGVKMTPGAIFTTLHFLCNLRMGPLC